MGELPGFDELPKRSALACAWGLWGPGDVLGMLNLITPERTVAASAEVRRGAVVPLDLSRTEPDPPLFGRRPLDHRIQSQPGFGGIGKFQDDVLHDFNTQVSTQWDGFRHVDGVDHGYYGGLPDERHGVDHWARHGIVGRAVLADIGRWRDAAGRPVRQDDADVIEAAELVHCLADQGTTVETGDVLLIRTGWPAWWRGLDADDRTLRAASPLRYPGLGPGADCAAALWNMHVSAVASDTPALEVGPASAVLPDFDAPVDGDPVLARAERTTLHVRLLVLLGIPIGELFDLEALAADCAADGRYSCMLTSVPLNLPGGIGSPPNAVAVK
jgi:kynurenine formamidase